MKTIWKAALRPTNIQEIEVPVGAEILHATNQHNQACVWFRCDPSQPVEKRKIAICGTGHSAPEPSNSRYLGTAMLERGAIVLHIFEQI